MTVLAATTWRTNAAMILDVVQLGYLNPHDDVIDLTYGRGKWWSLFRPGSLAHSDAWDFTCLPANLTGRFDVAVFDPPYVSTGGRETSTIPEFNDRYGLKDAPRNPELMHRKNMEGLIGAMKVVKPGGFILMKCANYVSSGRVQWAAHWAWAFATGIGLIPVDELIMVGHARVQPGGRPQQHARNNYSILYVFQKPKGAKNARNIEAVADPGPS